MFLAVDGISAISQFVHSYFVTEYFVERKVN